MNRYEKQLRVLWRLGAETLVLSLIEKWGDRPVTPDGVTMSALDDKYDAAWAFVTTLTEHTTMSMCDFCKWPNRLYVHPFCEAELAIARERAATTDPDGDTADWPPPSDDYDDVDNTHPGTHSSGYDTNESAKARTWLDRTEGATLSSYIP